MVRITSSKKEKKPRKFKAKHIRHPREDGDPVDNHTIKGIFSLDSRFRGNDISDIFIKLGLFIFILGFLIFILTFFPIIKEEAKYAIRIRSGNPTPTKNTSILTLMTCWPAGTDLKRLIIQAKITSK